MNTMALFKISSFLTAAFLFADAGADESLPAKCIGMYNSKGFLTQAQTLCGLKLNSAALLLVEKQCHNVLNDEEITSQTKEDIDLFNKNEKELGHRDACIKALELFPNELSRQDSGSK